MTILSLRPAGKEITYVLMKNDESKGLTLMAQGTLKVTKSTSRTDDLAELFKYLKRIITTHQVGQILVKASVSTQDMNLAHLHTAETRGLCVSAAIVTKVPVKLITTTATFAQSGKVKDSLKNDKLFDQNITGELPKAKRDLALLILNHFEKK